MNLSDNARSVLEKRYLLRSEDGKEVVETPIDMMERVARTLAAVEAKYYGDVKATFRKFFTLLCNMEFLPNSPTLANAGCRTGQLSACYVLGIEDNLHSIFDTIRRTAIIHQSGGGTGFSFSRLRPKNDVVLSTKGTSSGPLSFMDVYNQATEAIKQGGMRRGANMGILRVDHPDILDFIAHKEDLKKLNNFNISVAITDDFMSAVESGSSYQLINPRDGSVHSKLDASYVFNEIVKRAWNTGEPGIVFIDRMNAYCPVPWIGKYETTNPCAEQPLLPDESCNLGSINLEKFVRVGDGARLYIDWERLGAAARLTTRLLDNVVDANKFPDQQLHDMAHATRKIGLGIMGFARLLFLLQIPYGSEESCRLAGNLMSYIDWHSKAESIQLARERGAFPATKFHEDESYAIYESWFKERDAHSYRHADVCYHDLLRPLGLYGIRNSTTTTIAPTGTISIIADASSGCEPVFALAFKRWQADMHMVDVDPVFKAALKATEWPEAEQQGVLLSIDAHHGSLTEALNDGAFAGWNYDIHDELRGMADVFRTAHDVTPVQHINIQAAFQAFNDSATSKTINFPASATIEQVMESYSLAWSTGCKGVTIYRDGSREFQPLSTTVPQATAAVTTAAAELPELRQLGDVCAECGSCYRCGETCDCETKETINANA